MNSKEVVAFCRDLVVLMVLIEDGTNIEQVTNFPYLGQKITEDGRCEEEIKRRIQHC